MAAQTSPPHSLWQVSRCIGGGAAQVVYSITALEFSVLVKKADDFFEAGQDWTRYISDSQVEWVPYHLYPA